MPGAPPQALPSGRFAHSLRAMTRRRGEIARLVVIGVGAMLAALLLGPIAPAWAHPGAGAIDASQSADALPLELPIVLERDGVLIRAEAGLEQLAAAAMARVPETLAQIRADLDGLPQPRQIELRLIKRARDLPRVAPAGRGAPEWASGVAYPDRGIACVATRRAHQPIDTLRVVDHELAHLALGAALEGRAPRWLDEGFASVHASEWSMARSQTLIGMAWSGDTASLPALDRAFHGSAAAIDRAYAQSHDFVTYLLQRGRFADVHDDGDRWPFRRFLKEIGRGLSPDDAALEAYGVRLGRLLGEWGEGLRNRYLLMPSSLFVLGVWVLAAILLVLGYLRRRRLNRRVLSLWDQQEAMMAKLAAEQRERERRAQVIKLVISDERDDLDDEQSEQHGEVIWRDWSLRDGEDESDDSDEPDDVDELWLN